MVICKFWLHISKDEQLRRFKSRERDPFRSYKLTDEDWRNRAKWDAYREAVEEMLPRTCTPYAPWTVVEADDKYYARVKVVKTLADAIENGGRLVLIANSPRSCRGDAARPATAWLRTRTANAAAQAALCSTASGTPSADDAPAVEQQHALGPERGARQVVDHGEHGHATRANLIEHAEQRQLVADVQVRGRLVEQQNARLLGQAAGERRELALAGGERAERRARRAPRCRSARALVPRRRDRPPR